jgi:glycosyltransferase involved in cell wall biosynthesis
MYSSTEESQLKRSQRAGWICCQLGARENYAVARALHKDGELELLLTDCWMPPGCLVGRLKPSLRTRFHADLADAEVFASNLSSISFEMYASMARLRGWRRILARNTRFQRAAISRLRLLEGVSSKRVVVAYSYAALGILRYARAQGWFTVLNQIDPGPPEEQIVAKLYERDPMQSKQWDRAPPAYWRAWRQECELADRIVVNSSWSLQALVEEGIPDKKIRLIPLAYEMPTAAGSFRRDYPEVFTRSRPLRALFLGQINMRKGIGPLFDAIRLLREEPVEFTFVGPIQISIPPDLHHAPNVRWVGRVCRENTDGFFREADLFLFPTFSDGFGLTQLEAQAWRLPVLTTKFSGEVVEQGRNGWLLDQVSGQEIAVVLRRAISDPAQLKRLSDSAELERFGLSSVGKRWLSVLE